MLVLILCFEGNKYDDDDDDDDDDDTAVSGGTELD